MALLQPNGMTNPGAGGSEVYNLGQGYVFKQGDGSFSRTYDPNSQFTAPIAETPEHAMMKYQNRMAGYQQGQAKDLQRQLFDLYFPKGQQKIDGKDQRPDMQAFIGQQKQPGQRQPIDIQALMQQIQRSGLASQMQPFHKQAPVYMQHAADPNANIYMQNGSPMTMIPGQGGAWQKSYGVPYNPGTNPNPTAVGFNPALPRLAPTPVPVGGVPNNPANAWSGQRIVTQPLRVG
jgi:hypothetical protein